jgi:hypothetical protein
MDNSDCVDMLVRVGHESDKGLGGTKKKVTSVVFCPCIHAASAQLIDLHTDPKSIQIFLKS